MRNFTENFFMSSRDGTHTSLPSFLKGDSMRKIPFTTSLFLIFRASSKSFVTWLSSFWSILSDFLSVTFQFKCPLDMICYIFFPPFIADGLNPLTINHIARTTSFNTIGIYKISIMGIIPVASSRFTIISIMAAITPQIDSHLGMSFDLYSRE